MPQSGRGCQALESVEPESEEGDKVSTDFPRWRAFLKNSGGPIPTESAEADPLKRLAGALAFVRQGVMPNNSTSTDLRRLPETDLEIRDVGGQHSLEFTLEDQELGDITCRLLRADKGISAVFQAKDINTERLLKAEAGRLRVQLEAKGLKVDDIMVERET